MSALSLLVGLALCGEPSPLRRTPIVEVVERAGPSVVNISAEIVETDHPFRRRSPFDDIWQDFFGAPRRNPKSQSLGSGVVIDKSGIVLTNEHVIARASAITVTLRDRRVLRADVIGADPKFDIAVLKLEPTKDPLPVVEMGTSKDLMPGETVVAIGNPFGLSNSVTSGVISALHRSIPAEERTYEDFIQTDAAINPGNSGGALFNIEAKLIGINTAIYGGNAQGIGFAIPIDRALAVVNEVVLYGEVRPVYLGARIEGRGQAVVTALDADGPAARAGLRVGDHVLELNGVDVVDGGAARDLVRGLIPGQELRLVVERRGQRAELTIPLRELTRPMAAALTRERLGLEVEGGGEVLRVTKVRKDRAAARVGIRAGDALISLAGRRVRTPADFDELCAHLHDAEAISAVIGRGGRGYYVTIELGP